MLRMRSMKKHAPLRFGNAHFFLRGVLLLFWAAFLNAPAALAAENADAPVYDFAILMDGSEVGRHTISFERQNGELHVRIAIDIEVTFGPITFYRYSHRNHEVWKDGKLVYLETQTNDDGTKYRVLAKAGPDGLEVDGAGGTFTAPAGILPTSYWQPATQEQTQLLDTQRGRLIEVETSRLGTEQITLPGGALEAKQYKMTGDLKLQLWYGTGGELLKIAFEARGRDIAYAVNALDTDKIRKVALNER